MTAIIICFLVYLAGLFICYTMLRIEHESEKQVYTKGDRLLALTLSLLSFLWVLIMLVSSWIRQIAKTGYWNEPVKPEPIKPDAE